MSVSITKLQRCHRGIAFEFTGDGVTTVLPAIPPVQLPYPIRANTTATATRVSSPNGTYDADRSGSTGLTIEFHGSSSPCSVTVSPTAGVQVTV